MAVPSPDRRMQSHPYHQSDHFRSFKFYNRSSQSSNGTFRSGQSQGRSGIANTTPGQGQVFSINPATSQIRQGYGEDIRSKPQWDQVVDDKDHMSSLTGSQGNADIKPERSLVHEDGVGVKVTVERDFE